jgi:hypothetical protein
MQRNARKTKALDDSSSSSELGEEFAYDNGNDDQGFQFENEYQN